MELPRLIHFVCSLFLMALYLTPIRRQLHLPYLSYLMPSCLTTYKQCTNNVCLRGHSFGSLLRCYCLYIKSRGIYMSCFRRVEILFKWKGVMQGMPIFSYGFIVKFFTHFISSLQNFNLKAFSSVQFRVWKNVINWSKLFPENKF